MAVLLLSYTVTLNVLASPHPPVVGVMNWLVSSGRLLFVVTLNVGVVLYW